MSRQARPTYEETMDLETIKNYFIDLRRECMTSFTSLEVEKTFEKKPWEKSSLGYGEIGLLRGDIFEKAAVNFSFVQGSNFPMKDGEGSYTATGVSLITHMKNPHMPTAHFNLRFIELTDRYWFGGGFDLTPMGFDKDEDTKFFHQTTKEALDLIDTTFYPKFSEEAKNYFFIPHWKKERGVGGIFFDHFSSGDLIKDFEFVKKVGSTFLTALMPIYEKRKNTLYTAEEKKIQNRFRAHYVEFNLLYDRGTKFGFSSGGNPEAILCSMPPEACW